MTAGNALEELDDRWLLGWRGFRVDQIKVDYRLVFILEQNNVELAIGERATVTLGGLRSPNAQPVIVVPETGDAAGALPLLRTTVLSGVAFKTGALQIVFSSGHHLNVQPGNEFEAWTSRGPGSSMFVCKPGGGLSVWT